MLKDEYQYYLDHQDRFAKDYYDKVIVIKASEIIGVYETELDAYVQTKTKHTPGTFLIQRCLPKSESRPHQFSSRVTF